MALIEHSALGERSGPAPGWSRKIGFDTWFIGGIAAASLAAAALLAARPDLLIVVLLADLWLLSYHHVATTFTALCFDRASFERNRFLVLTLPVLVLGATIAIALTVGAWAVATVYFYWQWFHTARQSWGIAQRYRRQGGGAETRPLLAQLTFYAIPVWGILHRSAEGWTSFNGIPLRLVPVPTVLVDVAGIGALLLLGLWTWRSFRAWRAGSLDLRHTAYLGTHFLIFYAGYIAFDDLIAGWVIVNIWHTTQYLVFVRQSNAKRFRSGIDPAALLLSRLSQPGSALSYFLLCLALSTILYWSINTAGQILPGIGVLVVLIASQTLNFHHFIVDSVIWRSRRTARS